MYKIFDSVEEAAYYTAQRLFSKIQAMPAAVLGLATGSTMKPVYSQLLQLLDENALNLSQLCTYNLDKYIGLSSQHPQSYNYYMYEYLFYTLNLPPQNSYLL